MDDKPQPRKDSRAFSAICDELLSSGMDVRFRAEGGSMEPNIHHQDEIVVSPANEEDIKSGDVALTRTDGRWCAHRVVATVTDNKGRLVTRGDARFQNDTLASRVMGKVISIERGRKSIPVTGRRAKLAHQLRAAAHRTRIAARSRMSLRLLGTSLLAMLALLGAKPAFAAPTLAINFQSPANNSNVAVNSTVAYQVRIRNTGTTAATSAVVTFNDPSNLTYVSAVLSSGTTGWTCNHTTTPAPPTITCTDPSFTNGGSTTFTFSYTVNANPTATSTVATATGSASNASTVNATLTVNFITTTFSITNTPSVTNIAPGDTLTFTEVIKNTGANTAVQNEVVSIPDPPNTTYSIAAKLSGSGTWACSDVAGTASCTDTATYAAGNTTTLTFTYIVNAGTANGTIITSTASVQAANTLSPATTAGSGNITVTVPVLVVTNTDAPDPIAPGDTLTYSVGLSNSSGVNALPNVTVTMADPANTTFVSANSTGGTGAWACDNGVTTPATVTCKNAAAYGTGSATTFSFVFTINAATADGTVISGTANAQASNTTSSGTASTTSTVHIPDLSITNNAAPNPVATGGTITYTQVITNGSGEEAVGVSFTQTTPTNTTFTSATPPANWTCGTKPAVGGTGSIVCTANAGTAIAASGGTATLTVVVTVNPGTSVAGATITDTVTAAETGTDPNPANNTASASVTVSSADLQMTQSVTSPAPAVVVTGGVITYTEVVTNNGPSAAANVTLYQQTPPYTTFNSIVVPATPTGWSCVQPGPNTTGQIICTNASLASGAGSASTFTIQVNVNTTGTVPTAGTTIVNYADVTSTTADPIVKNNSTLTSTLVETTGQADLAVSASVSPTPVFIDSTLTYTIQVQNLGLTATTATTLTDTLPAGVTFISAVPSQGGPCTQSAGTVTCPLNSIGFPAGNSATVTIKVTTPANATSLTNAASVASTSPADPVAANNSVSTITVVQPLVCATPGKDGSPGAPVTSVVNTYFPPGAGVTSVAAGAKTVVLGGSSGLSSTISSGDLLLFIQMQGATINTTAATINTGAYGDGVPGDPGSGSTSYANTGQFEFVTATNSTPVPATGGTLTFIGTGPTGGLLNTYTNTAASAAQGATTFQVIRVPQYASVTLGTGAGAIGWTGTVGGVLVLDVSSQLTVSGTVSVDGQGFRGGGGRILTGGAGTATDYVTLSTNATNGSKGEGIAGTPAFIAPATGITTATTATATGQTYVEGYPSGSYSRGAPGNAGGGATDADPAANDQNSGGGGGGNGGNGGTGGFGWKSAGIVGGFGGVAFPGSTSAIVMGGGGGAGTTNNGSWWDPIGVTGNNNCGAACTGIFSSGGAGGGIVIIRAGTIVGTGTISANGLAALETQNDGGGGGGAGGTLMVLANSGGLTGLTLQANGGQGGITWPEDAPGTPFPANRHGPGGGGSGGLALLSGSPTLSLSGGLPGYTTLSDDSYGATVGQDGITSTVLTITQTPGTQAGAYCAGADLAVTNTPSPTIVAAGGTITYTQNVTNAGPFDAVNAVFSEVVPANTTLVSVTPSGTAGANWTCTTTSGISCTNPDLPSGASGNTTFTVIVTVNAGTASGTEIVDTASIGSGTNDPVLTNNTATAMVLVAAANTADVSVTGTASPNPVAAGGQITYTITVTNNGPAAAANVQYTEAIPASPGFATFASLTCPSGWTCTMPSVGGTGNVIGKIASLAVGGSGVFTLKLNVAAATPSGTVISESASVATTTTDPSPGNNVVTNTVTVASVGQYDLYVTSTASPNPVLPSGNISYTQTLGNNGPASATNIVLTGSVPASTTFVSLGIPSGWFCGTIPAVGGTGAISCCPGTTPTCSGAAMASGASVNFPMVVKVSAAAAPGTVISNTISVAPTANDVITSNNTITPPANTVVASPSQADVSIKKTASPEPVQQNTTLTYLLQVTNNGPAQATGVTVSDSLPAQVTYTSVSTTAGTCSQSAGTVSCNIGTMTVGSVVTITISVKANSFSGPTTATNTATVSSTSSDPNSANNSSAVSSTLESPTAVQLSDFRADLQPSSGVLVIWHTKEEVRNLGFHLYRDDATGRHRLDPALIAGSALALRGATPQHAAKTYQWNDPDGTPQSTYWLEDVDLNGTRTMHGPAYPEAPVGPQAVATRSPMITQLNHLSMASAANAMQFSSVAPHPHVWPVPVAPSAPLEVSSATLNGMPAVKISVTAEGWYAVTAAQIAATGFNVQDSRGLQLFAEGVEQPIVVNAQWGGSFRQNGSIEFYGTPIDTIFSGTRIYWLVNGSQPGKRIQPALTPASGSAGPASFPFTTILRQHLLYFTALLNGENNDNFFGAIVTTAPVDQDLTVVHSDPSSSIPTTVDVTLQGATDQQEHSVSVAFNGVPIGEMDFANQSSATNTFSVNPGVLHDGTNTVTLTSLNGDNDVSVVQSIALHYAHTYTADSDWLDATAPVGEAIHITGFANPTVRVFDVTQPTQTQQLVGRVTLDGSSYGITVMPSGAAGMPRSLVAFSGDQIQSPSALAYHAPNGLAEPQTGASYVVIAHPDFASAAAPLAQLHQQQGQRALVVTTDQVYDAFNYGEHSPFAIRDFLKFASTQWRVTPQAILLVGDASLDPRNYLGQGDQDFVPTRFIDTQAMKTASDDWLTDFNQTGFATIPTGRIPADTPDEAALSINRIVAYENGSTAGAWQQQATVIADQNIENDFTSSASAAAALLPQSLDITKILADGEDPSVASQQILTALNAGSLLVNYNGHGAVDQWSFHDIFDATAADNLSNGDKLPVFLLMDCLNGFFQDVYSESLAEHLMFAPNGGAIAVWASTGFTVEPPQATMNQALLTALAANPSMPLGQAILQAKSGITDDDVRRTWTLFGDPGMRIPLPAVRSSHHTR